MPSHGEIARRQSLIGSRQVASRVGIGAPHLISLIAVTAFLGSAAARAAPGRDLGDPAVRAALVARRSARAGAKKAAALRFARAAGLPVRGEVGGRVFELMEIRRGRPVYYITDNVDAAVSTAADLVRGAFGVDGAGFTVGLWDGGSVLSIHQEFTGRLTLVDDVTPSSHSTHVAGTIAAAGVDPLALGMAPAVNLDSYDWNADYAEMTSRGTSRTARRAARAWHRRTRRAARYSSLTASTASSPGARCARAP